MNLNESDCEDDDNTVTALDQSGDFKRKKLKPQQSSHFLIVTFSLSLFAVATMYPNHVSLSLRCTLMYTGAEIKSKPKRQRNTVFGNFAPVRLSCQAFFNSWFMFYIP